MSGSRDAPPAWKNSGEPQGRAVGRRAHNGAPSSLLHTVSGTLSDFLVKSFLFSRKRDLKKKKAKATKVHRAPQPDVLVSGKERHPLSFLFSGDKI